MKASQITPGMNVVIEMPNTDALACIVNDWHLSRFIEVHGDVIVTTQDGMRYDVPEFTEGRDEYRQAKSAACAEWGCE